MLYSFSVFNNCDEEAGYIVIKVDPEIIYTFSLLSIFKAAVANGAARSSALADGSSEGVELIRS